MWRERVETEIGSEASACSRAIQSLQEYPEMAKLRERAHGLLGKPGETVQMLGRLGYGPDVPPAPRWPLEAKLVNAETV